MKCSWIEFFEEVMYLNLILAFQWMVLTNLPVALAYGYMLRILMPYFSYQFMSGKQYFDYIVFFISVYQNLFSLCRILLHLAPNFSGKAVAC